MCYARGARKRLETVRNTDRREGIRICYGTGILYQNPEDMGVNVFDTAENYGLSECSLGNWVKSRGNRNRVHIITKGCHPYERDRVAPEDLRQDAEKSLQRLQMDYIDTYFLHRDDISQPVGPLVEELNELHKEGKIGRFGGSNWTAARIQEANAYAHAHGLLSFTVSSPHFGIAVQVEDPFGGSSGCVNISGEKGAKEREFYENSRMPVFAYSSLGRGFFTGRVKSSQPELAPSALDKYAVKAFCYPENFKRLERAEKLAAEKGATVPQIALAWILNQKMDVYPIVSSQNADRFASNVKALEIHLSGEEVKWLDLQA